MHGILALSSLVSLLLVGAPLAALPREEPFDEVTARFTREMLALNPISATAAAYHRHTDWRTAGEFALDELLDDYSAAGVAHRRISLDALEKELHRFSPASLDEQQQIDFRVMQSALDGTRFELDRVQAYRHNPVFYSNLIGFALFEPMVQEYAPLPVRLGHIFARLEKLPAFLEVA